MIVLLVHSKSNARINASRSSRSLNFSRRVLKNQPCAPDGVSSGRTSLLDAAVLDRREIVARRPDARGELLAEQIVAAGESFEGDVAVAIEFVADDVEIVRARRDTGRSAPHQSLTRSYSMKRPASNLPDLVGAGAERRLQRGLVERALRIIGAREDRQRRHEQRHVAAAPLREPHHHGRVVGRLDAGHVAHELGDDRMALLLEEVEREGDVVRVMLAAVVEFRFRPHQEAIGQAVGRNAHRARRQPVHRIGLVAGAHSSGVAKVSSMPSAASPRKM